jgi:predicted ATPase
MVAEKEQVFFRALALHLRGCLLLEELAPRDAVSLFQSSVDLQLRIGGRHPFSFVSRDLARACGLAGDVDAGLAVVDGAIAAMEDTGDRYVEPELYRVRAELLLLRGDADARPEAESLLRRAIAVAQAQGSKSWELRAAVSLGALWREEGRREHGRALIAETLGWFTEGFDTRDLRQARALLEAWS